MNGRLSGQAAMPNDDISSPAQGSGPDAGGVWPGQQAAWSTGSGWRLLSAGLRIVPKPATTAAVFVTRDQVVRLEKRGAALCRQLPNACPKFRYTFATWNSR